MLYFFNAWLNVSELYCGGFGVQHFQNTGRCGICGDPWQKNPREHEAPGGLYANGIITKIYKHHLRKNNASVSLYRGRLLER